MISHIINTYQDFLEAKVYILSINSDVLTLDVETDNKNEKLANLFGLSICLEDWEAFYFPIRKNDRSFWWSEEEEEEIAHFIYTLASKKKLINHNIIYDVLVLENNWGYDFTPFIYSDTILQKHLLDEERPFGLKEIAVKYLGDWANKAQKDLYDNIKANGGKTLKENVEMWKADTEVLGTYCNWDVLLTRKLFDIFEQNIIQENLQSLFYQEETIPLYKEVTIPMKRHGFPIDVPYFEKLKEEINKDIITLEHNIYSEIKTLIVEYEDNLLKENYPYKTTGLFPKIAANLIGFELPIINGKITLAKKPISLLPTPENQTHANFLSWLKNEAKLQEDFIKAVQKKWFKRDTEETSIFNLRSNEALKWLFFKKLEHKPLSKTETGEPQVDDDFLDSIKSDHAWVQTLIDYKKLNKLKSTYIEGVLEQHIDGVIYTSMLQFGTTSGRYSSTSPNLQNLPRPKEEDSGLSELVLKYGNAIRAGFIAGKGYKLCDSDYSQLEPRCFCHASGDTLLQLAYVKGEDLYGSIACRVFGLDCKPNEVKKLYPEARQQAKVFALAVVYGAEAGRISKLMSISYQEAQKIIDDYLEAYPELKNYMDECDKQVCMQGFVETQFKRKRHLPEAKRLFESFGYSLLNYQKAKKRGLDDLRWKFKNMLNLAKNHPIQGMAAHTVNRAAISIMREFKKNNIQGYIALQIHDQIVCRVNEHQTEQAKDIVRYCMENSVKLSVPLIAEPKIANNLRDSH